MKTSLGLLGVPCILFWASAGLLRSAPEAPTLAKAWSVALGPVPLERHFFRGAVCGDGKYYLSDGLGRVVEIGPDGTVLSDAHVAGLNALAIACDERSELVAAPANRIVTVGPDGKGGLSVLHSAPLASEIRSAFAIAPVGADRFLVLGLKGGAGGVHHVDGLGRLLASYESASTASPWSVA